MNFRKLLANLRFRPVHKNLCLGLFTTLLSLPSWAGTLPSMTVPDGVGINIHFVKGGEKDLDMIAAAGIKVVRVDFQWDQIERYKGVYDWSAYDELAANLKKRGLRPLFILDYSNVLYEEVKTKVWMLWLHHEVMSPRSPASVAAYARWASEAARHFGKDNVIWEIWNEPNIKFWKPAPDVGEYSRLAIATCNAIRAVDPNATIIGPGSSKFPWEYLEGLFQSGALNCLDAISVHPYRTTAPETAVDDFARLRKMLDHYTPKTRKEPIAILSGEWGYATVKRGIPQQTQADFAVRMQLHNLMNGVPLSVFYDWRNNGTDPSNYEHNYGIVETETAPKLAYTALKTMTTQLSGYRLVQRIDVGNRSDYVLLFGNAKGSGKLVAWTTSSIPHPVSIPLPPSVHLTKMTITDWKGLLSEIAPAAGKIQLGLGASPIYIAP